MNSKAKAHFVVSFLSSTWPKESKPLFIAEPFIHHLMEVSGLLEKYPDLEVAPCIRKGPEDLYVDNEWLWAKYQYYLPFIAEQLNRVHNTSNPVDFWRRALSMGLMRHLTMLYDFFKICETHFNPEKHEASVLRPDCYYIPANYDEHRSFYQYSHFGQEQLFSLYMRCFYPAYGSEFADRYQSQYKINVFSKDTASDPIVGIMGVLVKDCYLKTLVEQSRGDVNSIGFKYENWHTNTTAYDKRQNLGLQRTEFDRFDTFFFYSLPFLLPCEFVEDFTAIHQSLSRQLERYRRLRYVASEVFIGMSYESIALAILSMRGIKIIYHEHNYNEYPYYSSILKQQISFADIFAAHGNYKTDIPTMVHTGSLFDFGDSAMVSKQKKIHALYVGGLDLAKYPNYSFGFGEAAEHAVIHQKFRHTFLTSLPKTIFNNILFRSRPIDGEWNLCYNDRLVLKNLYDELNVDDLQCTAKQRMAQSRIIIIDYFSTPHLEALSMNVPTLITISPENYILNEANPDFFDDLSSVGIVQFNPQEAARFLERIWDNPEAWWTSPEVQAARGRFLEKNLGKPEYMMNYLLQLADSESKCSAKVSQADAASQFVCDNNGVYVNPNGPNKFDYSDGKDREDYVLNTLKSTRDLSISSDELRHKISDWVSEYHFSRDRHNLLRHLHIDSGMKILELGCGCGAITRQLGESGAEVTAVEGSYGRACCAVTRCRNLANVKVYCSNFQDIQFTEKYDIVTLIGVLEYSPMYFKSADPIAECLKIARNALKPEGVLIVAIENQLGLKYFCGSREDHVGVPFYGIEDRYNAKTAVTYGRRELTQILQSVGLSSVEFQYPFPDYKIPRAVFSQKAFHHPSFHPEEIIRQFKFRDYCGDITPAFNHELAVPVLCRNGVMEDMSNSFLIFASQVKTPIERLGDPNTLATFYTTDRAKAYSVQTRFIAVNDDILVRKTPLFAGVLPSSDEGVLIHTLNDAKYLDGKILEAEYRRCLLVKDFAEFSRLLTLELDYLAKHAVAKVNPGNPTLSEIHPEFIDCVPANMVLKDGVLHYIDQEWKVRKPVTLGALLLRTIDALCQLDPKQPELNRDNLIRSVSQAGFHISEDIHREYNLLIQEILSQVYSEKESVSGTGPMEKNPIELFLESVQHELTAQKTRHPESGMLWDRLCSHIHEMLLIYRGGRSDNYLERVTNFGAMDDKDVSICQLCLKNFNDHPEWNAVKDFTVKLMQSIRPQTEVLAAGPVLSTKVNPLAQHKKYDYGNSFKDYICPNPFLYMEYGHPGTVSCCCYLPFSAGNILTEGTGVWNGQVMQELRRSILSGQYSYCDKNRCAAMQEALQVQKKGTVNYQIPYQLIRKDQVDNPILTNCITTGRVDNLPAPEMVSFEDDPSCNLSCPSCRKSVMALNATESEERLANQKKLLDCFGPQLKELWLCGAGDVFAARSYRTLLQQYDFKRFPQLGFRLDTNGMLFNQRSWDTILSNVQNKIKLVAVSVDAATDATYRSIRRGGDFQTILSNLQFVAGLPQRKNGMRFIIRMIVQQKNFREMKQFVKLGMSLGVDSVVFSVLQNWGTFSQQEYRAQAVHLPEHPDYRELCEILRDDVFKSSIVNLGNLTDLYFELNGSTHSEAVQAIQTSSSASPRARVIAFYLPQYHPIPENDQWWGKGFTEWTNVTKAKPLYQGHYQPHLPADLGYYDLRVPEVRNAQAELAKKYGIEAFCYWHYWFAGHRLLERPFNEVVRTGQPDFPFCLGWANQTWSGIWHGAPNRILMEQTYPGMDDYKSHFYALLSAFRDHRYLKINGKLVFLIYNPKLLPDARLFTQYWQDLSGKEGLPGFHFIAHMSRTPEIFGCQSCVDSAPFVEMDAPLLQVSPIDGLTPPKIHHYRNLVDYHKRYALGENEFPLVMPNFDNTPRSGSNGVVLHGSTPELFKEMFEDALQKCRHKNNPQERIIFIKAWNEWAEGNHLEPDQQFGYRYLEAVRDTLFDTDLTGNRRETAKEKRCITEIPSKPKIKSIKPWSREYYQYRAKYNNLLLNNEGIIDLFRRGDQLPDRYAFGLDERSIEYPWFFAVTDTQAKHILDAGSALNHPEVLDKSYWIGKKLTIMTLAPEGEQVQADWIKREYGDLRNIPAEDESFDEVVCISTLEHIGMDNTLFTNNIEHKERRTSDFKLALTEMKRVLKAGGRLLLTVPFGKHIDYGEFQLFDTEMLDAAADCFGVSQRLDRYYYYSKQGWKLAASPEECSDLDYSQYAFESHWGSKSTTCLAQADEAVAAKAVVCCVWVK